MPRKRSVLHRSKFRSIKAANRLVEENIGLAYRFFELKRQQGITLDSDTLESLALFGLMAASRRWNPEKSRFSSFAFLCMDTELKHSLKPTKARAVVNVELNEEMPTDTRNRRESDVPDAVHDVEFAMRVLSAQERFVLTERTVNRSKLREVGAALGTCKERVRQIEVRALAKCRKRLDEAA